MDEKALRKVKKKHQVWQRYQQTREAADYLAYTRARNQARWATRGAIRRFERKIAEETKTNPKAFWRYAKTQLKTKTSIADMETGHQNERTSSDQEKAKILNDYFASVYTIEDLSNIPPETKLYDGPGLMSIDITEDMVIKKLQALNVDKSPGPDELHPRILKETAKEIVLVLTRIFQLSISTEKIPNDWRQAHVTPIHKKGPRFKPENYRPVSLTSVVGKVLESIIRDQIMTYIYDNNILADEQHGFVSGRSTVTQLTETLEEWTKILDFKKAFDTVPHQRLLLKLRNYGICGQLNQWLEDFLSNRKQRVVVNNQSSSWTGVPSGIPQGSVLGPILFVLFINDLPDCVKCSVNLYADDTKIYRSVPDTESCQLLDDDLTALSNWAKKWQMCFHPDKRTVLRIGKNHPTYEYTMQNEAGIDCILKVSSEVKDLGIIVDSDLNFEKHIQQATSKASRVLAVIRRTFTYLDEGTFLLLYKSLVRPHLEYGVSIWSPSKRKHINPIEKVQRRATKLIPGYREKTYEQRLRDLKLPSLSYRRARGDIIQTYCYTHRLYRVANIDNLLPMVTDNYTRGHSLKLAKLRVNTSLRQNFFSQRVVNSWNDLPDSVVTADNINILKSRLDRHWRDRHYIY